MKHFITLLVVVFLVTPQLVVSQEVQEIHSPKVEETIKFFAQKYDVGYKELYATINKETAGTFSPDIQSNYKYTSINPKWLKRCPFIKVGSREQSYGLAQIHICDHDVTKEQAQDPYFSVEFMARHFAQGHRSWWMGYTQK